MMKWINKKRNKKGFTLVELVVVIAILAVLAMIAIPKLGSSRLSSQLAAHNANVRVLKSASAMYLADNPTVDNVTIAGGDDDENKDAGKLKDYLDGERLPKRTVVVGEAGDSLETPFLVEIKGGDIVVIPGEAKINEEGKVVLDE